MNPIRILIADDHTLLRTALAELLASEADLDVVAVAGSAGEAVRQATEHRPHVVLLDIEMPGNDHPPSTVRALQKAVPGVRVLILTMHDGNALVQSLLPLGISGFLHKTVTHEALSAAVRSACAAGSPVTVSLSASKLLTPAPAETGPLSPRETEVVELASHGLSNYQIARRLAIVEGTVKRHMRSIFDKLEARSRVEAANKAVELGLISPPVPAPRRLAVAGAGRHRPMPIPPPTGSTAPVM
ncbi:response regulator transcription factor [Amycolatopsis rhabdoformis]|uniref:Response regulator transcription factor n=1 Tax=Amycolatopsis rhabdoformis TaxID=1448059 RepID=A0ABZ1I5M4_9PSEU|nr:response regulator transcription factor [Amycolatopsis rhabdoformis]WSE29667.1 response regulator transcription factor [Amycolatopsis rhabdoformis]